MPHKSAIPMPRSRTIRAATVVGLILMAGCALQTYPPYPLSDRALAPESSATVKVARSFGGPAVYLTYVDGVYVLDYPSMKGYPKDTVEANRLEPKAVGLSPGRHTFRVNFAFSDVTNKLQALTLLTLLGNTPVSYATFRKSSDIEFDARPGKVYLIRYSWDESKGAAGVTFAVDECKLAESTCVAAAFSHTNERSEIIPRIASPSQLMAR